MKNTIKKYLALLTIVSVISFGIGAFLVHPIEQGDHRYNVSFIYSFKNYDDFYEYIPASLLGMYYNHNGRIYFCGPIDFVGPNWSCGYYELGSKNIYVLVDGKENPSETLAHELAHFVYYNDPDIDLEYWDQIVADNWDRSVFSVIEDPRGGYYYEDPVELFAQMSALYMYGQEEGNSIFWDLEALENPVCASYIEKVYTKYYDEVMEVY